MVFAAATLTGSLLGGFLGQVDLLLPYVMRAAVLAAAFVLVLAMVRDSGFQPRLLKVSSFAEETRKVLSAGVRYGWRSPVLRPLLFVSLVTGVFSLYGFYSWQPYVLALLGRNHIWLLGVIQAAFSAATIGGNLLVRRVGLRFPGSAGAARVLAGTSVFSMVIVAAIGLVGVFTRVPGILPAAAMIALWLVWGFAFGLSQPVRSGFINEHIPSAQRATVLSLDSLFADAGGTAGQPALGYLSGRVNISAGWIVGAVFVGAAAPLYARARRAVLGEKDSAP